MSLLLLFRPLGSPGGGPTTIGATPGAYTWTGVQAKIALSIAASKGTYTWAGTKATFTTQTEIDAIVGQYIWRGLKATFGAEQDTSTGGSGVQHRKPLRIKLSDLKERPEYEKALRWTVEEAQNQKKEKEKIEKEKKYVIKTQDANLKMKDLMEIQNRKDEEDLVRILELLYDPARSRN